MENIFLLLGIALVAASIIGYFSTKFKQPLVLAYILTGFLLGPSALGLIKDLEPVVLMAEMGITFLLFTVGLHLSPRAVKDMGLISNLTGIGQVVIMTFLGYITGIYFGFSQVSSFYIGISIAFSSTIIIIKMLAEKNEINSLHGRISVGFLLVQDFLAVGVLVVIAALGTSEQGFLQLFTMTILKDIVFIAAIVLFTQFLIKPMFDSIARNQELLFLSSISYCFLLAISSHQLGLSKEIGAFLAGISLATLPYNLHIESKISPLRDFFIVVFFIALGAEMGFSLSSGILVPLIVLSLLVLLGTPVMLMIIMGLMGYRKRTSFLVGITVAQISEFSLILIALAYEVGHVSNEVVSLIIGVGVITIAVSAYMISYGHELYYKLSKYLTIFEKRQPKMETQMVPEKTLEGEHIVVVGYHRVGYGIVKKLLEMNKNLIVVDFDPVTIKHLNKKQIPCVYGDIGDPEIMNKVNLRKAETVISTAPDMEDNLKLLEQAKRLNRDVIVIITAEHVEEALELYEEGADYVILPHLLGSHHASLLLEETHNDWDKLLATKIDHIAELKNRQDAHPHHIRRNRK